jgi:nicotinate-nucleotide adenylyltransferase
VARLICLFGGTFDPVHYGHLKPLDELQQILAADAVHIIPASVPPHRSIPRASSQQRVDMLELALQEFPAFVLDTRELKRESSILKIASAW